MAQAANVSTAPPAAAKKKARIGKYKKWGYIFMIPFTVVFLVFQAWPLIQTFYYSVFKYFWSAGKGAWVGPEFVGFDNFAALFDLSNVNILGLTWNTIIMWVLGFVPQIIVSLIFAYWFTNVRLRLKCLGFFKTVMYMPNLIMASAFAMLIFAIFSDIGPVNSIIKSITGGEAFRFLSYTGSTMGLVAFMNFIMWFGNTTILLMAAMMGINESVIEAAEIDGANSGQIFWKITLPLIRPILVYVMITSLIGGLQMFDVPQILTDGQGGPNNTTKTLIMYLNQHIAAKNYGMAGALSVLIFIVCAALSLVVYYFFASDRSDKKSKKRG